MNQSVLNTRNRNVARCSAVLGLAAALAGAPPAFGAGFNACLDEIRAEATARGIAARTLETALAGVEPDRGVIEAMENQPEFKLPVWDYLAALVDEQRIAEGRAKLGEWSAVLADVEQRFGVDRHVVVAIWGIESNYGRTTGGRPLVRSLATVSCFGTRQRFFRGELIAALRILEDGDVPASALRGSWAGAFGQPQFMPSTFQRVAVDMDGDGRRDIVHSVPDALGSAANYLRRAGWRSGEPWGYEVRLPANYQGPSGRRDRRPLEAWRALGLTTVDGGELTGPDTAALLLPAGTAGPAFLVFSNFNAIYAYNAAETYALAIAHLADRLRGAGRFVTPWPTDDPGLSRAERRELQQRLADAGHDPGSVDGAIGPRTRAAIEAFQRARGLPVDGRAGRKLLEALRAPAPDKPGAGSK